MTLEFLLHANPRNRMAYEYLMACTLLKKDVGRFVHYYPLGADLGYSSVPKGYQEALLFYWLMSQTHCNRYNSLEDRPADRE